MPPKRAPVGPLLQQLAGQHLAVEDVAAGDAEALLELPRPERQAVRRCGPGTPGTPRRSGRWRCPPRPRRSASAGKHWQNIDTTWRPGGRQRVVGGGLAGGLDPGPRRGPARRGRPRRRDGQVVHREADVDRPAPGLLARHRREVGQPVEQHHHLHHRPGLAPALAERPRPPAPAVRTGSALESTTRARSSSPPSSTTPAARPSSTSTRSTGRLQPHPRARLLGGRAQRLGHRRPSRRARSPTRPAPRPPGRGRGRSRRRRCPGPRGRPACRSAPGSRTARAPPRRGCRPARRPPSPSRMPGPDRLQPALAVGRLAQQRPGALGRLLPALGERRVAVGVGARPVALDPVARALRGSTR